MKNLKYLRYLLLCALALFLFSCKKDDKFHQAEVLRAQKYNDSIVKIIGSSWKFNIPQPSPKVQSRIANWQEWQNFMNELQAKPKNSLDAFKAKANNLAEKSDHLQNNIPATFNKPQVKSRIGVLTTKVKMLYTYINLNVAQDKKVITLISEISRELNSIQNQFDEIIRISEIRKEFGEEEMLRALDTVRMANPDAQPQMKTLQPPTQQLQRFPTNTTTLNKRRAEKLKAAN